MKVLFCSPCTRMDCGIAMVGRCVIRYHDSHNDNIELDVMSQDRKTDIKPSMSVFYRIYRGGVEYMSKLREYRQRINQKRYDVIHITTSASFGIIPCWIMLKMAKNVMLKRSYISILVEFLKYANKETGSINGL